MKHKYNFKPNLYIIAIDNVYSCNIKIGDIFKVQYIGILDFGIRINSSMYYVDESFFIKHHNIKLHKKNKHYKTKRKIGNKYKYAINEYHKNNGTIIQLAGSILEKNKFN